MAVMPSIVAVVVVVMVIIRTIVDPAVIVIISLVGIIVAAVVVGFATQTDAETICLRIASANRQQSHYPQYQEKRSFHFAYFL